MHKPFQPVITWSHPDPPSDINSLITEPTGTPTVAKSPNVRNVSLLGSFGRTLETSWDNLSQDCTVFLKPAPRKHWQVCDYRLTSAFIFPHKLLQPKKEEREEDGAEASPEEAKVTKEEHTTGEERKEPEGAAEGEQGTGEEGQTSIFQSPLRLVKKGKMKLVVCRVNLLDGTDFTCEVEVRFLKITWVSYVLWLNLKLLQFQSSFFFDHLTIHVLA